MIEDCFYTAGIAQAATALAVTERLRVGVGIMPAVAHNPAILAMEIATLALIHPGRFLPGIGLGVVGWMGQVGARPPSRLIALEETVGAVRALLAGETVDLAWRSVQLQGVRLDQPPVDVPPVAVGVRGPKSLVLAERIADGTILSEYSAPGYVAAARQHIAAGMAKAGRTDTHQLTVYVHAMVDAQAPAAARDTMRRLVAAGPVGGLAGGLDAQSAALPFAAELVERIASGGAAGLASDMPDAWLDELAAAGTPDEVRTMIGRLAAAGADSVVLVAPPSVAPDDWLDLVERDLLPAVHTRSEDGPG